MPTYEYKCSKDGSKFELWQEVGSEAPPCPDCGAPSKKVFGAPRVHFKGSGFYLTDLRAEQSGGKSGAKDEAAPAAETKTETPTETKTEVKTDNKTEAATPASTPAATPASK